MLVCTLHLKVDAKLTTVNEIARKTSICEIGNYFWDNSMAQKSCAAREKH